MYDAVERFMRESVRPDAPTPPTWHRWAACVGTDPEIFYPVGGSDREPQPAGQAALIRIAKRMCNGDPEIGREPCPVVLECLGYAMARHEKHGIWGGMTYNERNQLRKSRYERDRLRGKRAAVRNGR
jgi:WhiB family redox-sensing transcriptional regulator